jgi:4-carboxymuconolactone decarboxylase
LASDIDPESGCRLPLLRREDLDEAGKASYDHACTGASIAGLRGPAGVRLYSRGTVTELQAINDYLRAGAGISPRIREIALLATEREIDSAFQWTAHEPVARRAGVPEQVISVIQHRQGTAGLDAADALVIELAREVWRDRKVSAETFAAAKAEFGPHRLVDLVLLMGIHAAMAAVLIAVDMQLPDGTEPPWPAGGSKSLPGC